MTGKVDIFNKALRRAQAKTSVQSETERSPGAIECAKAYPSAVREALASFNWTFARAVQDGTPVSNLIRLPGFLYAYAWPSDCVKMREIAKAFTTQPVVKYRITLALDNKSRVIQTTQSPATLIYTAFVDNPEMYDDEFIDALSWKLAREICGPLTKDLKRTDYCDKQFKATISDAKASDANQDVSTYDEETPTWIAARG